MNKDDRSHAFAAETERLETVVFETYQALNRAILTLSAAAIGLSLTFIERLILPEPSRTSWFLLAGTWIAFGLAIALTLASLWFTGSATHRLNYLRHALRAAEIETEAEVAQESRDAARRALDVYTRHHECARWLAGSALISFVAGLVLMCVLGIDAVLR